MNLYLKHGKKLSTISSIQLKNFSIPAVGKVEIDHEVEPAIWFKTPIIDSILIDCDVRNIYWREKSEDDSGKAETESMKLIPKMTRAVYEEGDCEDFEVFDAVVKFLKAIDDKKFSGEQRAQEILRIIHLYVLPEIVLKTSDLCLLQDELETVEEKIYDFSEEILSKQRGITLTENSLRAQRDKMFSQNNFESEKYLNTCNVMFLEELLFDVVKDIDTLDMELSREQACVDRLRDAVTDEGKENLRKARTKRDEIYQNMAKYQSIRETIKNVTVRPHSKKRKKIEENVFHEIYLELKNRLLGEKQLLKQSCDKKVKMTSVREAIVQARDELLQMGESYGFETSRDGQGSSTDVLETNNNKPANWQTLEEKIKLIIYDGNSGPSKAHATFCESINTKMEALIMENELFQNSGEHEKCLKGEGEGDEFVNISYYESLDKQPNSENSNMDRISSGFRTFTNAVKGDLLKHIDEMTSWLIESVKMEPYSETQKFASVDLPHKVWICYESHLYNKIMPRLSKLYRVSYVDVASKLKESIEGVTLLQLGIDELWLNNEFPTYSIQSPQPTDDGLPLRKCASLKSGLSLTLGRMTLDELYQSAEKDCQSIPEFLNCPLDEEVFAEDSNDINERHRLTFADDKSGSNSPSMIFETVEDVLQPVCTEIGNCLQKTAVVEKLKALTKAYRLTNKKVCKLKSKHRRDSIESMVCCDEILSASIVLLTMLDREDFIEFYSHLNLLIDLIPSFLSASVHDCSLTNFYSAYQYLFDKQVSARVSR